MRMRPLVRTTLQEMIHDKIFVVVLVLSALIIALSFALGALSFSEQKKILADFGFLAIEVACLVMAAFSGSYMIAREVEKQTCLLILSRPVSRFEFIIAKYLGVLSLNALITVVLALLMSVLLGSWDDSQQLLNLFVIALSIFLKSAVVAAVAFVFSLLVRPVIALMFSVVVYLLGHWIEDLKFFAAKFKDENFKILANFFDWVCPRFYRMNWKSWYFLEKGIGTTETIWMIVHCIGWIFILTFFMQILFRRKDIV